MQESVLKSVRLVVYEAQLVLTINWQVSFNTYYLRYFGRSRPEPWPFEYRK